MFNPQRALQATAIMLMFVAAYFTWGALAAGRAENFDYALVAAALGLCAWFMRYRFELKNGLLAAESDEKLAGKTVAAAEINNDEESLELEDSASPHANSQGKSQINYVE